MNIVQFEIIRAKPPIFDRILEVFPLAAKPGVLFCWGKEIYNPSNIVIPDYLIAHENVHRVQQDGAPAFWWEKYLVDTEFRLKQEIPAHQAEYRQFAIDFPQRNMRRLALRTISERLSGQLYCNMISYDKARALVKEKPE